MIILRTFIPGLQNNLKLLFRSSVPALHKSKAIAAFTMQVYQQRTVATQSSSQHTRGGVAIIGGGIAGLSAAARLSQLNIPFTVFDAGTRVPGGRACSRIVLPEGSLSFDHGAQFLAPKPGGDFEKIVEKWEKEGVVAPWQGQFRVLNAATFEDVSEKPNSSFFPSLLRLTGKEKKNRKIYVGTPSMGSIAQHLAKKITGSTTAESRIQLGTKVSGITWDAVTQTWTVTTIPRTSTPSPPSEIQQNQDSFRFLIIADALAALPDSAFYLSGFTNGPEQAQAIAKSIQAVSHEPVFSLMVAFDQSSTTISDSKKKKEEEFAAVAFELPSFGVHTTKNIAAFQWIAKNSSKPGRNKGRETWVAITTPEKAKELFNKYPLHTQSGAYNPQTTEYRDKVAKELLDEFLEVLDRISDDDGEGKSERKVKYCHAQRWGRGFVSNSLKLECCLESQDIGLASCGDFCSGIDGDSISPIEAAWNSGQSAAETVHSWMH